MLNAERCGRIWMGGSFVKVVGFFICGRWESCIGMGSAGVGFEYASGIW